MPLTENRTVGLYMDDTTRAGLRHRPTRPWPMARGFSGPALSKVKEMCRQFIIYSRFIVSHEKSEKCFGLLPVLCIRVCLLNREAVVTVASHVTPASF